MSVHNESLEMHKATEEAPSLEYRAVAHDSLSMFLAAIGGAVMGTLLTLLVLAIINNGSLNFSSTARLIAVEQTLTQVDRNVGTLSTNLDVVASEINNIRTGLTSAEDTLRAAVSDQSADLQNVETVVAEAQQAIDTLNVTRLQFETFVGALTSALQEVSSMGAPSDASESVEPGESVEQ